jgi:hypothetical protein
MNELVNQIKSTKTKTLNISYRKQLFRRIFSRSLERLLETGAVVAFFKRGVFGQIQQVTVVGRQHEWIAKLTLQYAVHKPLLIEYVAACGHTFEQLGRALHLVIHY